MAHKKTNQTNFKEILKALGLVFGDIGTSPIYTLSVIFIFTAPTPENVAGVLSLIFWTLVFLVTIQYTFLAMYLDSKGEGGVVVLKEILHSNLKKGKSIAIVTFLGYVGVSLLMGDGVLTPAISILSAVEGMQLIPGIGHISTEIIVIITVIITILLFSIQSKGTDKVAASFGPIMVLWFSSLFLFGLFSLLNHPSALLSLSPHKALEFMSNNGLVGFIILAEVILCATGGEALYADMGHLGKEPIRKAWIFVFIALLTNYFGQGAYVITHNDSFTPKTNVLFSMVKEQAQFLYLPFLILTLASTIIASQAMISAVFSLVYQGIRTHIFPLTRVKYTSTHLKSQIYIDAVNWMLLGSVIVIIVVFKSSSNLAAAYGFAVTATMAVTTTFMLWIFFNQKKWLRFAIAALVYIVNLSFLIAVFTKIPHGGYWSIIIASFPFGIIYIWIKGNRAIYRSFRSLPIDTYLVSYEQIYSTGKILPGTALFFAKSLDMIPPYMVHCTLRGGILYENNVMVSIVTTDSPRGVNKLYVPDIAEGLSGLEIQIGYMERLNIPKLLKETDIDPKVMFYGVDDIKAKRFYLKIFAFIKRITPNFVQFIELPYQKLHGVLTRIEI